MAVSGIHFEVKGHFARKSLKVRSKGRVMSVSVEDVRRVADLANLELSGAGGAADAERI